jgi:hypothetical protein
VRIVSQIKIDLKKVGGSPVLAGALNGKRVLGKLVAMTAQEPFEPEPVFLNFSNVEVATASFLRESILGLRNIVRGQRSNFYPVIANANAAIRDELSELVGGQRSDVLVTCTLSESGKATSISLVGELEPVQRRTFDLVCRAGETDASGLMRAHGATDGTTRTTAWNNRLTSLSFLGLLVEVSQGRTKRYRPLFRGAEDGL